MLHYTLACYVLLPFRKTHLNKMCFLSAPTCIICNATSLVPTPSVSDILVCLHVHLDKVLVLIQCLESNAVYVCTYRR